jgi:hypothetical protein
MKKTASITIIEEPEEESPSSIANIMAIGNGPAIAAANQKQPDYYNSGSTEDAADTPLVLNRLETVRSRKKEGK